MSKYFVNYQELNDKEKQEYNLMIKQLYTMLAFATLLYYGLPFALGFLGEKLGGGILVVSLMSVFPVYVFACRMINSAKYGTSVVVPLALGIFFIPTALIFYGNPAMAAFGLVYFIMGMFGEFTGFLFKLRKKSKRGLFGIGKLGNDQNGKTNRSKSGKISKKNGNARKSR